MSRRRTPTACTWTARRWTPGPASRIPTSSTSGPWTSPTMLKAGRTSALGVLHRWYGPGQGRPASSPGLLLQLSLWYADGARVVHGSDGSWHEHPAEWLPSPPAQRRRGRLRGVGGRARASGGVGEPGIRRIGLVAARDRRPRRHGAVHADVPAAHHHPRDAGASRPAAHGGRRRGGGGLRGHLRGAAQGLLRAGRAGAHGHGAGGLPARSGRAGVDPARDPGDQSHRLVHHARQAARPSRPSPTSASATCR